MSFSDRLKSIFKKNNIDEAFYKGLKDSLIESDCGYALSEKICKDLQQRANKEKITNLDDLKITLHSLLVQYLKSVSFSIDKDKLLVLLILGVNGVGKTTSCAKLMNFYLSKYHLINPLFSACDTFRAAATEQLMIHGERLGLRTISQKIGSDPGAVLWDSLNAAKNSNSNLLVVDTAGRMHTRKDLVRELAKLDKIVNSFTENSKKILVLDSTTGQNAFSQAEMFSSSVKLDAVFLTKNDSSGKGGITLRISSEIGIPICFLGTGEGYQDIEEFNPNLFLKKIMDGA